MDDLQVKDVATWVNEELPHTEQIIEGGILPQKAIALIGGIAKQGKSIFALNMGLQIATGKPFLEQFNIPNTRKVLYLQAEISPSSMQNRSQKMLRAIDYGLVPQKLFIVNERGIKLDRNDDLELLNDCLNKNEIEVLILDPLYKFHRGDENTVKDMTSVFDRLDWLVQQNNLSIVVVHHFGKPSDNRSGAHLFRGSSTITDYADSYMMLNRYQKEDRNLLKVSFLLRNDEEPEPMVLYRNPETLWYEVHDVESDKKVTVRDVIACLKEMGGSTGKRESLIDAIMDKTRASKRLVNDVIRSAEKSNSVLTVDLRGKGKPKLYYLPEMESKIRKEMEDSPQLFSAIAFSANAPLHQT